MPFEVWFPTLLAFLAGSLWVVGTTLLSERLGPNIGGIITGLPSKSLISMLFLGWYGSSDLVMQMTTHQPLFLGLTSLTCGMYYLIARRNSFAFAFTMSVVFWFLAVAFLIQIRMSFWTNISAFVVAYLSVLAAFWYFPPPNSESLGGQQSGGVKHAHKSNEFFRVGLSGAMIGAVVWGSKIFGSYVGSILNSCPVVAWTSLLVLNKNKGFYFTLLFMRNFIISGALSVAVNILVVRYFLSFWNPTVSILGAFVVAVMFAICYKKVTLWLGKKTLPSTLVPPSL